MQLFRCKYTQRKCFAVTAEFVAICKQSEHISRGSSLTASTVAYTFQFFIHYIRNILHWFVCNLFILRNSACGAEGKNSLLVLRLAALQFKNPLSCTVPANESRQPLNKNCQFLFRYIGWCRHLAGRQSSLWILILI